MNTFATKKSLQTIVETFRKPWQLFMYHPIKFEIADVNPATKTTVHSRNINGTTYYLASMRSDGHRDKHVFVHDGRFRENDFLAVFDEFARKYQLINNLPVTIADQCYTKPVTGYLQSKNVDFTLNTKQAYFCVMNEIQKFKAQNNMLPELPAGYTYGSPNTSNEADLIFRSNINKSIHGVDFMRQKLQRFPSLCIRKDGKLAGFISTEIDGALAHLLVFQEHRGQNLGEKLEAGVAKMALNAGITPTKFIETSNEFYLEKTRKAKNMDIVSLKEGKPVIFDYNVFNPPNFKITY